MTVTKTDAADLSATELLAEYEAGTLSPVEAAQAVLDRIERENPRLNAFCLVDEETTLGMAREAADRRARGATLGPLDGVPVSIKDVLLTRGWPTLRGSRLVDEHGTWDEDAPSVARLREQGAVFVGKTTTPELGWKGVTDSPRHGVTRNPWDVSRTAGGSSGGSAAAVALGMCVLALGTDGGGSVRIPAAFTGTFALKPTYGRVPHHPASPFGTLAHVGPMTRSVVDAAIALDAISGFDGRDWSALPPPRPDEAYVERLQDGWKGRRVAFSPTLGYVEVEPEVAARVREAVEVLAGLGAEIEEVDPGFDDPAEAFRVLWYSGAAKAVAALGDTPERRERLDPGLREICAEGERFSARDYLDATAVRMSLGTLMGRFHETYDLLVTPTVPIPAFAAGRDAPEGVPDWVSWTPFTYPFNMTQQPAASLPCGRTSEGLPVGLQVVGPRHADARVLAACAAFETAAPWPPAPTC